jgi:hypothetical protein
VNHSTNTTRKQLILEFFGTFVNKSCKNMFNSFSMSVCPSISAQHNNSRIAKWTLWNLTMKSLLKFVNTCQFWLKSNKFNGKFTWRHFCTWKWLGGDFPDYLGYLENSLSVTQPRGRTLCDNVITQPASSDKFFDFIQSYSLETDCHISESCSAPISCQVKGTYTARSTTEW